MSKNVLRGPRMQAWFDSLPESHWAKRAEKEPGKHVARRQLTNREKWNVMEKGPKFHGTK